MKNSRKIALCLGAFLGLCTIGASAAIVPVTINNTTINYSTNQLTLNGQGFKPSTVAPTVSFNATTLTLISSTNSTVTVGLPPSTVPGTYQLVVTNSTGAFFLFNVTYGAVGPQGPIGPQGTQGP